MELQITPLDDLIQEAQQIQDFLEEPNPTEIEAIIDRGNTINSLIARTGKMTSDAKFWLNKKIQVATMEVKDGIGKGLPASTLNNLITAMCDKEDAIYKWCDRLNRTATHQLGWLRSIVSKEKEQMKYAGGFNNQY